MTLHPAVLLLAGVSIFVAAWAAIRLHSRAISLPIVLVAMGALVFALPWLHPPDPERELGLVEGLTQAGLLVALMGAGLKLDRPIGLRRWGTTWRLLGIAMPLTIAAIALTAHGLLGLPWADALLIGAALAPTDPVLAADVAVGEPTVDEGESLHREDEVRFALTSEAGLNDGLAFPFVLGAMALATSAAGGAHTSFGHWFAVDLVYRVAGGVAIGAVFGWIVGVVLFRRPAADVHRLADHADGIVAVAVTLLAYGAAELVHTFGFVAVFVAALAIRATERRHSVHQAMHDFSRQLEELLVVGLLVLFGAALVNGLLDDLSLAAAATATVAVFVVRPLLGRLALLGSRAMTFERRAISFFGVRGIGSLYYVAYALRRTTFAHSGVVWSTVAFAVLLSIVVHGITATPIMRRIDGRRRADRRAAVVEDARTVVG